MTITRISHNSRTYFLTQCSDIDLNIDILDFFGYGERTATTQGLTRTNFFTRAGSCGRWIINITVGDHDAEIEIFFRINAVNIDSITIPASAGAVIYVNELGFPVAEFLGINYRITGGRGAGTTTMRGFSQEVTYG